GSRPSSSPWMTEAGNILHKDLALTAGNNRPYPDSDGSGVNRAPFRGAGESEAPGERFRVSGHEPRGRGAVMDDLEPHPVPGAHRRGRERVVDERGAIAGDVLGDRPAFHFSAVVRELERAGLQFRAGRKPFDADVDVERVPGGAFHHGRTAGRPVVVTAVGVLVVPPDGDPLARRHLLRVSDADADVVRHMRSSPGAPAPRRPSGGRPDDDLGTGPILRQPPAGPWLLRESWQCRAGGRRPGSPAVFLTARG